VLGIGKGQLCIEDGAGPQELKDYVSAHKPGYFVCLACDEQLERILLKSTLTGANQPGHHKLVERHEPDNRCNNPLLPHAPKDKKEPEGDERNQHPRK